MHILLTDPRWEISGTLVNGLKFDVDLNNVQHFYTN